MSQLLRHVIQLQIALAKPADRGVRPEIEVCSASAFVINIRGYSFLISAGHVIRDLREFVRKANYRIKSCQLVDLSANGREWPSIPFPVFNSSQETFLAPGVHGWSVFEDGADFLVIQLGQNQIDLLKAGGVLALDETSWDRSPEKIDRYFLLGFPASFNESRTTDISTGRRIHGQVSAFSVPVEPCDPPDHVEIKDGRFFATVPTMADAHNGKAFDNLSGMSGGPIVACRDVGDSEMECFLYAVQSAWLDKSRIIIACPIKPLAAFIAAQIEAILSDENSS